jgi:tRNA(Ile)-lysidine synthase
LCHAFPAVQRDAGPFKLNYDVSLLPTLLQFVRKHQLIRAGDRIGIAVSGGADSVALLRALVELRVELGCILSVVHLHHSLRGADADADAAFVEQLAAEHSLEFHLQRRDVAALASKEKLPIEAAGRRARLEFFAELQRQGVIDKVATAHTANDQAETVLLKFLRGAGTRGLAAIYPISTQSGAMLIRPLLDTTRAEVESFLRELHQPWREDATNKSPEFLRNRVRHELLPILVRDFNPAIVESLANTAEISREEQKFWDVTVARALTKLARPGGGFDSKCFLALPIALQRRVLIAAAELPLDFVHIERTREFILANQSGEREIARGLRLRLTRDSAGHASFEFTAEASRESSDSVSYSVSLHLPGEVELPDSSRLVAELVAGDDIPRHGHALDAGLVGRTVAIRNWRPGDRYQRVGRGEGKVKDFFQQLHIPVSARATWPVAELDGKIIWVLGLPVAAGFAAQGSPAIVIQQKPGSSRPEVVTSQDEARRRK